MGHLYWLALPLSEYTLPAHLAACRSPGLKELVCLVLKALGQGLWLGATGQSEAWERWDISGMCAPTVWLQVGPLSLLDWRPLTLSYLGWLQAPIKRDNDSLSRTYTSKPVVIYFVLLLPEAALHHLSQRGRPPERVWQGILPLTQGAFVSDLAWPAQPQPAVSPRREL